MDPSLTRKIKVYPKSGSIGQVRKSSQNASHAKGVSNTNSPRQFSVTGDNVVRPSIATFHDHGDTTGQQDSQSSTASSQNSPERDYDSGFAAGKAQAESVYASTVSVMQKTISELEARMQTLKRDIEIAHTKAVIECFEKVFPALMTAGAGLEIRNLLAQVSQRVGSDQIRLTINPDIKDDIETLVDPERFAIRTDHRISPNTVRVGWKDGGASVNCEDIAKQCQAVAEAALETVKAQNS